MRDRVAWAILVVAFVVDVGVLVGIGCTGPAFRRTISTTRVEVGSGSGTNETDRPYRPDTSTEADSQYVAISIQPFAALEMRNERDRDEELAQSIAYATATRVQLDPVANKQPDNPASEPWYLSGEMIAAVSSIASVVALWQRQRIGSGVKSIVKRVRRTQEKQ